MTQPLDSIELRLVKNSKDRRILILDCFGNLTTASDLHSKIWQQLIDGKKDIVINLGCVSYFESSQIAELITYERMIKEQGGKLKLIRVHEMDENVSTARHLVSIFDCYNLEKEALESFDE